MNILYFDNNATTAVDENVVDYQNKILKMNYANASSQYPLGRDSKVAIEKARDSVRDAIGANRDDRIIFTAGVFPIKQLVSILRSKAPDALFHTDAVQAMGKLSVNVTDLGVDYLSISGHKFYAPKGVGALYIAKRAPFHPYIMGGHQENNLRAGTENIASICAMGLAMESIPNLIIENQQRQKMRNCMEKELQEMGDVMILGQNAQRLPNTSNIAFKNILGDEVMLKLASKGIYVSTGSACNSVSVEPSHVLKAMKVPNEYIHSIRISFSSKTNGREVRSLTDTLKQIILNYRRPAMKSQA